MISLDDAFSILTDVITPLSDHDSVYLPDALGRISASDVTAPYALPRFTNTGVDGYAFIHEEGRSIYDLVGASYAGEPFTGTIKPGQAARIATGAVLPDGADTVGMQEYIEVQGDALHINDLPTKGSNLRYAGADIAQGSIAVPKGQKLSIRDIALLGALGLGQVNTLRPVRIAIASTGLELKQTGASAEDAGTIIDTNSLMLRQMLSSPAVKSEIIPAIKDEYEATRAALVTAAAHNDLIITTGGVSVGDRDFVRDVLHKEGKVHFWKIAIRPGKPVIFASIDQCLIIALPGNPVSAFVTCNLIVRAALNLLWGGAASMPEGFSVRLSESLSKPEHLRCFFRAKHTRSAVIPYADQSSNLYSSLTAANGLIDLPLGRSGFDKGDEVIFYPFEIFS